MKSNKGQTAREKKGENSSEENLLQKHCVPCEGAARPYARSQARKMCAHTPQWHLTDEATVLTRQFSFRNFSDALTFVNRVGKIAEKEDHHPDILLYDWNKVTVTLTTHAINGLSENDFILAAKIDKV